MNLEPILTPDLVIRTVDDADRLMGAVHKGCSSGSRLGQSQLEKHGVQVWSIDV